MNQDTSSRTIRYSKYYRHRVCEAPFVIWFRERSGSSFLRSVLNSHPDILCRHEDFNLILSNDGETDVEFKRKHYKKDLRSFDGPLTDPTRDEVIGHFRKIMSQQRVACGFKFKFDIQIACYDEIVEELHWICRHLQVIFLTRRNLLKQAVSRQNMERVVELQQESNVQTKVDLPPLELDIDRALKYAQILKRDEWKFQNSVNEYQNVHRVVYEDLINEPEEEFGKILDLLKVKPHENLRSKLQKITPNALAAAISNYDQLCDQVRGTDFEQFLD